MNDQISQHIAELEAHEAKLASVKLKLKKAKMYTNAYFVEYEGHKIARVNKLSDADGLTYWQVVIWDEDGQAWSLSGEEYRREAMDHLRELILEGDNFVVADRDYIGICPVWKYLGEPAGYKGVSVTRMW